MLQKQIVGLFIALSLLMASPLFAQSTPQKTDTVSHQSTSEPDQFMDQFLEKFIMELNRSAPIQLDAQTTWDNVFIEGKTFVFKITTAQTGINATNEKSLSTAIQGKMNLCKNRSVRVFLDNGYSMRYIIGDPKGNLIGSFLANHEICKDIPISDSAADAVYYRAGLQKAIEMINQSCPMLIDENTTLIGVSIENEEAILYRFTISDKETASAFEMPENKAFLENFVINAVCSDILLSQSMLPHYNIRYRYLDASGKMLFEQTITKNDCGK